MCEACPEMINHNAPPGELDLPERIRRLRNLEQGYSLGYAVEFHRREYGWNIIDELERLAQNTDRTQDGADSLDS